MSSLKIPKIPLFRSTSSQKFKSWIGAGSMTTSTWKRAERVIFIRIRMILCYIIHVYRKQYFRLSVGNRHQVMIIVVRSTDCLLQFWSLPSIAFHHHHFINQEGLVNTSTIQKTQPVTTFVFSKVEPSNSLRLILSNTSHSVSEEKVEQRNTEFFSQEKYSILSEDFEEDYLHHCLQWYLQCHRCRGVTKTWL